MWVQVQVRVRVRVRVSVSITFFTPHYSSWFTSMIYRWERFVCSFIHFIFCEHVQLKLYRKIRRDTNHWTIESECDWEEWKLWRIEIDETAIDCCSRILNEVNTKTLCWFRASVSERIVFTYGIFQLKTFYVKSKTKANYGSNIAALVGFNFALIKVRLCVCFTNSFVTKDDDPIHILSIPWKLIATSDHRYLHVWAQRLQLMRNIITTNDFHPLQI